MRVLFIAQHRPNRSPSQRFRFEQYLDYLGENGVECEFSYLVSAEDDKILYEPRKYLSKAALLRKSYKKRMADLRRIHEFNIVFVQREAFMTGSTFFEEGVRNSKAKLVFDFDDSIWLQNVSAANRSLNFLKRPEKTKDIIRISDHVVAGNRYLADYAARFNPNVSIIPTTIDTEQYRPMDVPKDAQVVIGWSGSITTIQHFEFAVGFLKKVKSKYVDRIRIKVIGDGSYRNEALGIEGIPWIEKDEVRELSEIDIGIMPLPDDEWAKGKCGLKGLQYMALEIPTIMSPVGVNSEIIKHGENGMLASSEKEWVSCIEQLIDNAELRKQIGQNGRKTVVDEYSVEANRKKYLDLFRSLIGDKS